MYKTAAGRTGAAGNETAESSFILDVASAGGSRPHGQMEAPQCDFWDTLYPTGPEAARRALSR